MPKSATKYNGPKRTYAKNKRPKCVKLESTDNRRGSSCARGYNYKWQRARVIFLNANPLCEVCEENDTGPTQATVVDHRTPHRGDKVLFWDSDNWQALCKTCHDRKTGKGQ